MPGSLSKPEASLGPTASTKLQDHGQSASGARPKPRSRSAGLRAETDSERTAALHLFPVKPQYCVNARPRCGED